jgi:alpha-glucosidase (family GH31 glycosyl hydrolase)
MNAPAAAADLQGGSFAVRVEDGEAWFGGVIDDGVRMPLQPGYDRHLVDEDRGNQIQPLLVSSRGRYVWGEAPFGISVREGSIDLTAPAGSCRLQSGFGDLRGACRAAQARHFPPSGAMPDERLFSRPQYNTWIELMYDQAQLPIQRYADRILAEGYPPGVLMIDDSWQQANGTWEFHPGRFANPKGMVARLHAQGFAVMLWVCPFISPDTAVFRELEGRRLLLRDRAGETAVRRWWNGLSAVLDLTHPEAVAWLRGRLDHLVTAYGVDGFKFDAGDPLFYRADDQAHVCGHRAMQTDAWARFGLSYPLNEYRSCYGLGGQALAQRLRDKNHAWDDTAGLGTCIPNALAMGLVGYPFLCPDMIGGGEINSLRSHADSIDQELVVRYAQCAALFPMMQFSVAPWRILSPEHAALCLEAARLHVAHAPLILDLARHAACTGDPIMRHLAWAEPDGGHEPVRDQFMLGDDLLIAPVVERGARVRLVRLPRGHWRDDRGILHAGGQTVQLDAPLDRLPRFKRERP